MAAQQKSNRIYFTGLYMRLSRDDEGSGESTSIATQRAILRDFAVKNGLFIAGEYVDDGFSGTNYDRPDFQRMMRDVENGVINCVITKDLSRLGRNSGKTTTLLEEIFPSKGVRYIAVNDSYDSERPSSSDVMMPMMLAFNEIYARDISRKIRSSFQSKMEKGERIAAFAPYGYRKDPENKNRLLVDEESAQVVRELFDRALHGEGPGAIARSLNERGVLTPSGYRASVLGGGSRFQDARGEWTSASVCKLLKNTVYLGRTEQGKTRKLSFQSKLTVNKSADEWYVVENTHEPIVSKEDFDRVQQRRVARRCPPKGDFQNVFAGVAFCADCGRSMVPVISRKKGCTCTLCCNGYKVYGAGECSNHFLDYDLLSTSLLQELQSMLSLTEAEREEILEAMAAEADAEKVAAQKKAEDLLGRKVKRLQELDPLIRRAFEAMTLDQRDGGLYAGLLSGYEKEKRTLEEEIARLRESLPAQQPQEERYRKFYALLEGMGRPEKLTAQLVRSLVDRIEVEQGHYEKDRSGKKIKMQTVRICYKFIGCTPGVPG